MAVAPGAFVAFALALLGLGLIAAAFLGEGLAALRLFAGLALVVIALLVAGAQALLSHAASPKEEA